jgi:hypothetical protein
MKKFKEWLYEKEKTLSLTSSKPKKVAHDPEEEKGKSDGWQPEVSDYDLDSEDTKDELPKDTIWVHNADQWTDKDRTAK